MRVQAAFKRRLPLITRVPRVGSYVPPPPPPVAGGVVSPIVVRGRHRPTPGVTLFVGAKPTGLRYATPPIVPPASLPLTGARSRFESPYTFFGGNVQALSVALPAASVGDREILAGAGIEASKCQQQYERVVSLCDSRTPAFVVRVPLHCVYGATGTIVALEAWAAVPCGPAVAVQVSLYRNDVMVLSAPVTLTQSAPAYARVAASVAQAGLVAGDVLEVSLAVPMALSPGTLPLGVSCRLTVLEDPQ